MKSFIMGFVACYCIAGITAGMNSYEIPATTKAGAVYAGVMWMPLNILPESISFKMVPSWAFDFENPRN